jgi:hypothetical protein
MDIPLYLHQAVDPTDQISPDRSATKTTYRFSAPNGYTIKPKDRLTVGDTTMIVTVGLVTPDSLPTFEAQDT